MPHPKPPIEERVDGLYLRVRVQPKAARNALSQDAAGGIRVALTAPPVDNAANQALCAFLADLFGLSKRAVALVAGAKSRQKTVRIDGLTRAALEGILSRHLTHP